MKIRFTILFCLLFLFTCFKTVFAQADLQIGQWAQHLPFNIGMTVTQSPTRIYYGTESGLLAISKADTSDVEFFSKVDGLSDVGPTWFKYHDALKALIIGYKNGNIDI